MNSTTPLRKAIFYSTVQIYPGDIVFWFVWRGVLAGYITELLGLGAFRQVKCLIKECIDFAS